MATMCVIDWDGLTVIHRTKNAIMKMITLKNRGIKEIVVEEILENHREERKVVELDLSYNHLTKLKGIEKFVVLVKLDISYNRVKRLIDLPPTIRILRAHHNILNSIVGISNLKQLEELDVSHNRMSTLKGIYNNRKLKILNASHNRILTCDGMETLRSLEELDLSYNNISDFLDTRPLRFLKKLHSLWIVGNPVYKHHPREYYLFMCQQITKSLRTLDGKKMVSIPPVTPQLENGYKRKRKPKIPKFGKKKKKKKGKSKKKRTSGKKKRRKPKKDRTAEEMLEGILQYSPEFVKKNLFLDGSQYREDNDDDDDDISDSDDEDEEEERYGSIHRNRRGGKGSEEDESSDEEDSDDDEEEEEEDNQQNLNDSQRLRKKKKKIVHMENENEILDNIVSTLRKSIDDEHRTKVAKKSGVKQSSNNIFEIFPYISPKSKKNGVEEDDSDEDDDSDEEEEDDEVQEKSINREDDELDRFDLEEMGGPSKKSVREQIDTFQEILHGRKKKKKKKNRKNRNDDPGKEDEHSIINQLMDDTHPPYPYQPIEHVEIQPREEELGRPSSGGMDRRRRRRGKSPSSVVSSSSSTNTSNVNTPQVDYRYGVVGSRGRGPPSTASLSSSVSHPSSSSRHHHHHQFTAHPSSGGIRRGGPKLFPPNQPTPPIFQRAFDYETTQKPPDPLFNVVGKGGGSSHHVSPNRPSPSVGSVSSYYQSIAPTDMSARPPPPTQQTNIPTAGDEEDYLPAPSSGGGVMWDGQGGVRPVANSVVSGEYPGGGSYGGPSLEKFDKLYEEYHKMLKQNQSLQTKTEYLINLLEVEKESSTVMKKLLGSKEKEIEQLKHEMDKQRRTSLRKKKRIMMSYNRMEKRKLSVESDNDDHQKTIETLKEQLRRAMDRIKRHEDAMIVLNRYINKLESSSGIMDEEERKERIHNISLFEKVHRVLEPYKSSRKSGNSFTSSSSSGSRKGVSHQKSSLAEFAKSYQRAGRLASAGSSWANTLRKR